MSDSCDGGARESLGDMDGCAMSVTAQRRRRTYTVAVVGPPNTGKSTLFNALTGFRQHVGNYPGVTVEKRIGHLQHGGASGEVVLVDLPGMYSLSVESADEAIVLDVLGGLVDGLDAPDVILVVVDATKLHRHLFLVSQLLELDRPVVVALNMTDLADARGVRIDTAALSRVLGTAVVPIVATRRIGIAALRRAVTAGLNGRPSRARVALPPCVSREVEALGRRVAAVAGDGGGAPSHVGLLQMLLHPNGHTERELVRRFGDRFSVELSERRRRIEAAGAPLAEVEAAARYGWIDRACQGVVTESGPAGPSRTVAADRVLTHRVYGLLIFMGVLVLVFQALYTWAAPLMDGIDAGFVSVQRWVTAVVPDGAVQSLVANGVVAGVGGVLVFLPQILILFLFIAILEDCGYMARAAFLVDRYMSAVGLNGKAVIPLLSSFACAVPGIMATRTIGGRNDRLITMLIAPLMSCSARLPVYTVLIGAFIAPRPVLGSWVNLQAVTLLAMYVLGVVVAIVVALVLRRTVLKGASPPFLMELPTYKWPSPSTVFYRMYEQGRAFCVQAGTIIFAVTIIVWALGYYPRPASVAATFAARRAVATDADALAAVDQAEAGAYLRHSALGRIGAFVEPVVRPLGWDWRIGMAAIASFPAREVVIATLGTIYNLGGDVDARSGALRARIREVTWPDGTKVYNTAVALSLMVFFALCCQCASTLAVMKRETNTWRWPMFAFVYMTVLAYAAALVTYQVAVRVV